MSSLVNFTKMSGAGNDFVVIDNRSRFLPEPLEELARAMCPRKTAVGADGLIVVEVPVGPEDFSMRYYNSDGSEADLCGNGARCVAVFARLKGIAGETMRFTSRAGPHTAAMTEGGARVSMPAPTDGPRRVEVPFRYGREAIYVVVGVPHVVIFHENPSLVDVEVEGRLIRQDPAFAPDGANVDFVQVLAGGQLRMRTYERGVEAETLACGTGAVASAVAACIEGFASMPVDIETAGGEALRVHGVQDGRSLTQLELEGPACVVYEGVWDLGGTRGGDRGLSA